MHLDDGVLEALLDGELDSSAAAEARAHVASCADCRSQLEALRADEQLLIRVLPSLDHSAHPTPVSAIVTRARRQRRPLRWAAGIALLVFGAGALYAIPGSPLRRWVDRLRERRAEPGALTSPVAGIAMAPGARFHIVFVARQSATGVGAVTIALTDRSTITARRIDGTARFSAEIDGLRIETSGAPATFDIGVPSAARWVEVLVGGRRVFLKDGAHIVSDARPDSLGRYTISLH